MRQAARFPVIPRRGPGGGCLLLRSIEGWGGAVAGVYSIAVARCRPCVGWPPPRAPPIDLGRARWPPPVVILHRGRLNVTGAAMRPSAAVPDWSSTAAVLSKTVGY